MQVLYGTDKMIKLNIVDNRELVEEQKTDIQFKREENSLSIYILHILSVWLAHKEVNATPSSPLSNAECQV